MHRDIKLENIFLDSKFDSKLGDLGCASRSSKQKRRQLVGSSNYMAPEVMDEQCEKYDEYAADIYAMGLCLFIMLTGEPLYNIDQNNPTPLESQLYVLFM